jgi:serine/threonine protein kinase/tetratricopeptide (TPR) repeat protein
MTECDIFMAALDIESADRRIAFLDEACGNDRTLRSRVEALLTSHSQAGAFLEEPAVDAHELQPCDRIAERGGTVIGPYKLFEQIGEGGFGVVFLAEQERPVRRRVALKIIKPGMDTQQVIARFEAERQALAMMDHSNIAKVHDAGATENGRPYFVMELVQGVPITDYCDQCNLTTRERLKLFITVCQAVQHAHQKGVIHRDIKPTNVLVAIQDGQPAPKIIDFGVAKAINQPLTEHTLATGFAQIVGTPLYMSPEQAELSPLGVDTRSDIYSLGVLLYELLTSTTPFDKDRLHDASYDEMRRIIREEEPPRPSSRISTLAANLATTIAERRHSDARRLSQTVRGELDWIVMKCLEKDRNRRYETANALALDIDRCLNDEPVRACPPSAAYRLEKFARRNRPVLVTAGLVAAALLVGTVLSVWQAARAKHAETLAKEARAKAEANALKARQAVDEMYTQVAEKWLAHQSQMEPVQREFLEKALRFYTHFAEATGAEPAVRLETARAYRRIAEIQHRLGEPAQAEDAFHRAVDHLQSLVDEFPSMPAHRTDLAATLHRLGVLLGDTGRYQEEEKSHRRALALEVQLAAEFPSSAAHRSDLGRGHWFVGQVLLTLHRREEAEREFRSALHIQNNLVRAFPTDAEYRHHLAQTYLRLGLAFYFQDRVDEYRQSLTAAAELLEALVIEFPTLPDYRNELANVYYWHVYYYHQKLNLPLDQTERYLRRAITLQETLVADYPSVTDYRFDLFRSRKSLGHVLMEANEHQEAEDAFRQAATMAEQLAADAPTVHYYRGGLAHARISMGDLSMTIGRLDDAEASYREAIRLLNALVAEVPAVPQYRGHLERTHDKLADLLTAAGRTEDAVEVRRNALSIRRESARALSGLTDPLNIEPDQTRHNANSQSSMKSQFLGNEVFNADSRISGLPPTTDH